MPPKKSGNCLAAVSKPKYKTKTHFVEKMRSMVLNDLFFSQNQLLIWPDDWYTNLADDW
jgi:hypothetical protein